MFPARIIGSANATVASRFVGKPVRLQRRPSGAIRQKIVTTSGEKKMGSGSGNGGGNIRAIGAKRKL